MAGKERYEIVPVKIPRNGGKSSTMYGILDNDWGDHLYDTKGWELTFKTKREAKKFLEFYLNFDGNRSESINYALNKFSMKKCS